MHPGPLSQESCTATARRVEMTRRLGRRCATGTPASIGVGGVGLVAALTTTLIILLVSSDTALAAGPPRAIRPTHTPTPTSASGGGTRAIRTPTSIDRSHPGAGARRGAPLAVAPVAPLLDAVGGPILVGGTVNLSGSGFSAGSVIALFVSTGTAVVQVGPFTPSGIAPTALTWNVPASVPLGNGFAALQIVNTDQGFASSNVQPAILQAHPSTGRPAITALNGVSLDPPDLSVPLANISTVVVQNGALTITGTGFSNPVGVLYSGAPTAVALEPIGAVSATQMQVLVPSTVPTGPGALQVLNRPSFLGSSVISVPIGERIRLDSVHQHGGAISVTGAGFSERTIISFFNLQGTAVVNLGGLVGGTQSLIPFTLPSSQQMTFQIPAAAVSGPAYVQLLNPPFIPFTSTGNSPAGALTLDLAAPQVGSLAIADITQSSATLSWITSEAAVCTVRCGMSNPAVTPCAQTALGAGHQVMLSGLTPNQLVYVRVACEDAAGNVSAAADTSLTTLTAVPSQPSLVTIDGRRLLVRKRLSDGTLAPPSPYVMRGVNWSPADANTNTSATDAQNAQKRRPEFADWYATDLPLIKAMNANTVRLFIDPGLPGDPNLPLDGLAILDACYRDNLMVVMTVDDSSNVTARIQPVVERYRNHPAILMWSLGSEWNINRFFRPADFPTELSAAQAIETAAALVKSLDPNHPVASSYGNLLERPNAIEAYVDSVCPSVDVWSFNEYRGRGFSRFFDQWRFISAKPMFLGEYGIDAYSTTAGAEDQTTQAAWVGDLWNEIARNLSADDPARAALGGFAFELTDEWWKVGSYSVQDTGGWQPAGFPDRFASEDWWGILSIDRTPRALYAALQARFAPGYMLPAAPSSRTYRADSVVASNDARFWEDSAQMYVGRGASLDGGRGFNVAAIDRGTGRLRDPIQRFDTWLSRHTGTATTALINYLNAVPDNTLVLIAVADEAGMNFDNSCMLFPYQWVADAQSLFVQIGSTHLDEICYRSHWALIATRDAGEWSVLAEAIGAAAVDAQTQATVSLSP